MNLQRSTGQYRCKACSWRSTPSPTVSDKMQAYEHGLATGHATLLAEITEKEFDEATLRLVKDGLLRIEKRQGEDDALIVTEAGYAALRESQERKNR